MCYPTLSTCFSSYVYLIHIGIVCVSTFTTIIKPLEYKYTFACSPHTSDAFARRPQRQASIIHEKTTLYSFFRFFCFLSLLTSYTRLVYNGQITKMFSVERVSRARTVKSRPRSRREIALKHRSTNSATKRLSPKRKERFFSPGCVAFGNAFDILVFVRAKRGPDYMMITFVPR